MESQWCHCVSDWRNEDVNKRRARDKIANQNDCEGYKTVNEIAGKAEK